VHKHFFISDMHQILVAKCNLCYIYTVMVSACPFDAVDAANLLYNKHVAIYWQLHFDHLFTHCHATRVNRGSVVRCRRRRRHPYRSVGFVQFAYGLDLAFLLHAAVLKPDLDLSLGEWQLARQLDASTARQIAVELKVFLELQRLEARVRLSTASSLRWVGTYTPHQYQQTSPQWLNSLIIITSVKAVCLSVIRSVCVYYLML